MDEFINAFAMMETMRKGGTHWECRSRSFLVFKGDKHISYSIAWLDAVLAPSAEKIQFDSDCALLFFPEKSGNNVIILTTKYLKTIVSQGLINLKELNKNEILFTDRYEWTNDIPDERSGGLQEGKTMDSQDCGSCVVL